MVRNDSWRNRIVSFRIFVRFRFACSNTPMMWITSRFAGERDTITHLLIETRASIYASEEVSIVTTAADFGGQA